jgi:sec-independent protein translocase protein TatC
VAGAIITPTPDIFTQSMIALPIIVLYEVGYFIVRYVLRR